VVKSSGLGDQVGSLKLGAPVLTWATVLSPRAKIILLKSFHEPPYSAHGQLMGMRYLLQLIRGSFSRMITAIR